MFDNLEWRIIATDDATVTLGKVDKSLKGVADSSQKASEAIKKSSSSWKDVATGVFTGQLALNAASKAFNFLKDSIGDSIKEAQDFQTNQAQLNAVLLSTKNTAGVTIGEVNKMAQELSDLTSVDDDVINSLQAMQLTFTNIKSDVFKQTTLAALDLATAMNGGVTPNAEQLRGTMIQLGKAINNPIEGVSALTRVGITFSEQQKKQIEDMIKVGDVAGAQKVVLAELAKETGGSATSAANTFQGAMNRLNNAFGDVKKAIGNEILPILTALIEKIADFVTKHIPPFIEGLKRAIAVVKELGIWVIGLAGAALGALAFALAKAVIPVVIRYIALIAASIIEHGVWATVTYAVSVAQGALSVALSVATSNIIRMTIAAAPWIAVMVLGAIALMGIVLAIRNWDKIRDIVKEVFTLSGMIIVGFVKDVVNAAVFMLGIWTKAFTAIGKAVWAGLKGDFDKAKEIMAGFGKEAMDAFDFSETRKAVKQFGGQLSVDVKAIGSVFAQDLGGIKRALTDTIKIPELDTKKLLGDFTATGDGLKDKAKETADKVKDAMKKLGDDYNSAVADATNALADLENKHSEATSNITGKIEDLKTKLKELKDAYNASIGDMNKSEAEKVVDQQDKITDLKKKLADAQKDATGDKSTPEDQQKVTDLQAQLTKEETALRAYTDKRKGLETEITEARRRANETDFERFIEDLNKKRTELETDHAKKITDLQKEISEQEANLEREKIVYEAKKIVYAQVQAQFQLLHDSYTTNLTKMNDATQKNVEAMKKKLIELQSIVKSIEEAKAKAGIAGVVGVEGQTASTPSASGTSSAPASINVNLGGVTVQNEADEDRLVQKIVRQLQLAPLGSQ